ncbi:MAG TPA: response regulator transcription factor [Roseiflexaceae bacterium]|nr:response regulator transcription factor [Roseiflexaceae bacterium]
METLQIFLADDHAVVREGLKALIDAQADMHVIGEAGDGRSAWHQARDCQPDVLVLDISMPTMNGMQTTVQLKRDCPNLKVLVLSVHEEPIYLRELLAIGAAGYILKHAAAETLIHAIRVVAGGGIYLDPAMAGQVITHFVRVPAASGDVVGGDLSEREREVVQYIAQGYSYKEIAAKLTLSAKTVDTYRIRALKKLGLPNRAALVRYALEHGWLHDA